MTNKHMWATAALLVLVQSLFVASYVASEHSFYFWDHAMYIGMARDLFALFQQDPVQAVGAFQRTLSTNYPAFFVLPDFLTFSLFGTSRLVFILTNFFFFFVPMQLALALVLRRIFWLPLSSAVALTPALVFAIPPFWIPLLQGYPDNAALAVLIFGLLFLWEERFKIRNFLIAGLLLGAAVLLRRHYAYAVLALVLTNGLFDAWKDRKNFKAVLALASPYATATLAALGLMGLAAPDFLRNAVTIDYTALYHAYKVAAPEFLTFALNNFGWILALDAVLGLVLAARVNEKAARILALTTVWLVVWCAGPAEAGPHYVLQLLPLAALVGLVHLCFILLRHKRSEARVALLALALFLSVNSVYALALAPHADAPNWRGAPGYFSAARPPAVREDYDQLTLLARTIAENIRPDDQVLVVGSSFDFNLDLLRAVYTDALNLPQALVFFLPTPEIDTVQEPPFDVYASATLFVVPNKAQYHLDPSGQKVVTALSRLFPPAVPKLFTKIADEIPLRNGIRVSLYRRMAPWPPAALRAAMTAIRETTDPEQARPRRDWIITRHPLQAIAGLHAETPYAQGIFGYNRQDMTLFYDHDLTAGPHLFRAYGAASPSCGVITLTLSRIDLTGAGQEVLSFDLPDQRGIPHSLAKEFSFPADGFLSLSARVQPAQNPTGFCTLSLQDLSIR